MNYWLMKSEPETYSIDDLKKQVIGPWEGVRNYQARNHMRDDMRVGDKVLFYHSSCDPAGVAGLATICKTSYPDPTALDPKSPYFDPKASKDNPRWFMVDVKFASKFKDVVTLHAMKANPKLSGMLVTKPGQRLSIQPVEKKHYDEVLAMAKNTQ